MTEPAERKCPANSDNKFDALTEALSAVTISSTCKTITIACADHDAKDAILDFLTCGHEARRPLPSTMGTKS
jgi:hypothetical protein